MLGDGIRCQGIVRGTGVRQGTVLAVAKIKIGHFATARTVPCRIPCRTPVPPV